MPQLNQLVGRLIEARVDFVLVGGFAAIAHGVSLMTEDVDICCRFGMENLAAIEKAIRDLRPVHRMTPQKLPFVLTPKLCEGLKNLYLDTDFGPLDCLSSVLGLGEFDEVKRRSIEATIGAGTCRLLDIDALIDAKFATNRTRDRMTILQLRAIKERQGL
jgi:hypothetical protein